MTYDCSECKKEFEHECTFGDDVTCPHCGTLLATDFEEYWDQESGDEWYTSWVIGKASLGS